MAERRKYVCWSCQQPSHFLPKCPNKVIYPMCHKGHVISRVVQGDTPNKGRQYQKCFNDCGYFLFTNENAEGETSEVSNAQPRRSDAITIDELSSLLERAARVAASEDVEIKFSATIRRFRD